VIGTREASAPTERYSALARLATIQCFYSSNLLRDITYHTPVFARTNRPRKPSLPPSLPPTVRQRASRLLLWLEKRKTWLSCVPPSLEGGKKKEEIGFRISSGFNSASGFLSPNHLNGFGM